MVALIDPVAVDSSFLLDRSHSTFLGANLLVNDGHDNTYAYGILRSLLRLIKKLGRCQVAIIVTAETLRKVDCSIIDCISSILEAVGIPVHFCTKENLVTVCHSFLPYFRGIVSESIVPLQFVSNEFIVIRPNSDHDTPLPMDCNSVRKEYGIEPIHIATFLALTTGPRYARLTVRQTQRLIRAHGGLDEIYQDLPESNAIAAKLHASRQEILERYRCYHVTPERPAFRGPKEFSTGSPTADICLTARILRELGCHSLVRLL